MNSVVVDNPTSHSNSMIETANYLLMEISCKFTDITFNYFLAPATWFHRNLHLDYYYQTKDNLAYIDLLLFPQVAKKTLDL